MKRILIAILITVLSIDVASSQEQPKLVVGIVVDQMKQEYLWRFYNDFDEGGFKRMVEAGFMAKNAHYNYATTSTGPGHASIYTGTTPSVHGIVNNSWYSRKLDRSVYCAEDMKVGNLGGSEKSGKISPVNLYSSTITDELKWSTQKRGKVIAMSIKDRGSALPGGHLSDGSYWFDSKTGEFMTSTYYMNELPAWIEKFNQRELPKEYLSNTWDFFKSQEDYTESGDDDSPYERGFRGKDTPTLPYELANLYEQNGGLGMISSTPWGNTLLVDLAITALDAEQLGQDDTPDFLAVSFSSTDYIGHNFGPQSKEIQDTYIRLDRELARLFDELDQQVGQGEYVVFLSADHGVAENSTRMKDNGFQADNMQGRPFNAYIQATVSQKFGSEKWFKRAYGTDLFLDHKLILERGIDLYDIQLYTAQAAMQYKGVYLAMTGTDLVRNSQTEQLRSLMQNAYHPKESGDVKLILDPAWQNGSDKGTGHGNAWSYDTHIPILFYGWGIEHGSSIRDTHITDIAPTISMLLNIRLTSGNTGQPIHEALKK